jgi:hypothetical protein
MEARVPEFNPLVANVVRYQQFSHQVAGRDGRFLLSGFIGPESTDKTVHLYMSLAAQEWVRIPRESIIDGWHDEHDPTTPALLLVSSEEGLRRHVPSPNILDDGKRSNVALQKPINDGGSGAGPSCQSKFVSCQKACLKKYPKSGDALDNFNQLKREACEDDCRIARRICRWSDAGVLIQ